jgi:hypothetical protein
MISSIVTVFFSKDRKYYRLLMLNNYRYRYFREDNELNIAKQPAVRKIGMLPNVMSQLKKVR